MFHKLKKTRKLTKTDDQSKFVDSSVSYDNLESPLSPGIYSLNVGAIIKKKRNGEDLTAEELSFLVSKVLDKSIREVQIGAFLMAVCTQGLISDEIFSLTNALTNTGAILEWPREWRNLVVDEHSTGGVGDKVSVILAPALAVCGLKVSMMFQQSNSNFMAGTLEKLSSIPGFRSQFTIHEIRSLLSNIGCCIVKKAEHLVPCNDLLFQDSTSGTEDCPYLMIASVISEKAAQGIAALVLDVKFGPGAFTQSREEARCIAYDMLTMGWRMGIKTSAIVSSMEMPIGNTIGHALEIVEAIECLKGRLSEDIFELVIKLGAELLHLLGYATRKDGAEMIANTLQNGTALKKFRDMLQAQNVSDSNIRNLIEDGRDIWSVLPRAPSRTTLQCPVSGYVHCVKAVDLGRVVKLMGIKKSSDGRLEEEIDSSVGLQVLVNPGMPINKGQDWLIIHHKDAIPLEYKLALQHAIIVKPDPMPVSSLITEIIAQ